MSLTGREQGLSLRSPRVGSSSPDVADDGAGGDVGGGSGGATGGLTAPAGAVACCTGSGGASGMADSSLPLSTSEPEVRKRSDGLAQNKLWRTLYTKLF